MMGRIAIQGKNFDVRASNNGRADKDMLYQPTNGLLYDKERFIDIQLFHKGVGERGENINLINQGMRGEIDEFGYGQRITQPFIAQSLMDKQKQIESQKEIETDFITQGKIQFLRQQGMLRENERLGTFLPSARNGMRKEILPVKREAVEDFSSSIPSTSEEQKPTPPVGIRKSVRGRRSRQVLVAEDDFSSEEKPEARTLVFEDDPVFSAGSFGFD